MDSELVEYFVSAHIYNYREYPEIARPAGLVPEPYLIEQGVPEAVNDIIHRVETEYPGQSVGQYAVRVPHYWGEPYAYGKQYVHYLRHILEKGGNSGKYISKSHSEEYHTQDIINEL